MRLLALCSLCLCSFDCIRFGGDDNMLENKECWQQDCVFSIPQRIRWIMNGTSREGAESFLVDHTNATFTSVAAFIINYGWCIAATGWRGLNPFIFVHIIGRWMECGSLVCRKWSCNLDGESTRQNFGERSNTNLHHATTFT